MSECPNCQAMGEQLVEVTEANNALQNSLVDANRKNGRLQAELTKLGRLRRCRRTSVRCSWSGNGAAT